MNSMLGRLENDAHAESEMPAHSAKSESLEDLIYEGFWS